VPEADKDMDIKDEISRQVLAALGRLHPGVELSSPQVTLPKQREMGDYAAVLFPAAAKLRVRPNELTARLAEELTGHPLFKSVEASAGFLNFRIRPASICSQAVAAVLGNPEYGSSQTHHGASVMVEYSSPNTNKPLHLGHVRNNVLGMSLVHLFDAVGYRVHPVCLVNDRGIHICKSMVAYRRFGNGQTPASTGEKGDHLVGRFYVQFETALRDELRRWTEGAGRAVFDEWVASHGAEIAAAAEEEAKRASEQGTEAPAAEHIRYRAFSEAYQQTFFNEHSELGAETRETLRRWEEDAAEVRELWKTMNGWVYDGFAETYHKLGSRFEKVYHESETFLLGNRIVDEGLAKGVFYQKEDGSVWIDFEDPNLGSKLLRRRDGTSVYMTQDLGTAVHKFEDFGMDLSVYVVGSEQNYHFQVLFEILGRMGYPWAERGLYHMSYGMVYLPSGKMKSREGTVVDADELIADLTRRTREKIQREELRVPESEIEATAHKIALGGLKFYMLLVTPTRDMHFDPQRSITLQGDTGVSIQYAVTRVNSIEDKAAGLGRQQPNLALLLEPEAVDVSKLMLDFPRTVERAAEERNPSLIAQYLLELEHAFTKFYDRHRVLAPGGGPVDGRPELSAARLALCRAARAVLTRGLALLGIETPARM
jgi:arginyl-tRNA synthetase